MRFSASIVLLAVCADVCLALPAAASSPKSSANVKAASSTKTSSTKAAGSASTNAPATGTLPAGMTPGMTPSDKQISNAVASWMNDTGKVTKFLNTASSLSGDEFTKQATIALNAEKDELNHKMVLDAAVGQMPSVQAANDTLATQGTFQAVVDALQSMVDNGPDTAQAQVDAINMNRCVNVLPNIDAYFAAAGTPESTAVRPTGCLEVQGANVSPAAAAAMTASPDASGADTTTSASTGPTTSAPKSSGKSTAKSTSSKTTSGGGVSAKAASATSSAKSASSTAASDDQSAASDASATDAPATDASSAGTDDASSSSSSSSKSGAAAKTSASKSSAKAAAATKAATSSAGKTVMAAKAKPT